MNAMKTVYLHGALAKTFGKGPFRVNGQTTQMVIIGLTHRFGQAFKNMIREGRWHIFKNAVKVNHDIAEAEVAMTLGATTEELHVVPETSGSGRFFQLIAGVVLLVVGAIMYWTGYGAAAAPVLMKLGAAMIIGGVAALLTPLPNTKPPTQAGGNPSTMFNGTVNVTEQGVPMFICYGRVPRASSIVAAAWLTTQNVVPTST